MFQRIDHILRLMDFSLLYTKTSDIFSMSAKYICSSEIGAHLISNDNNSQWETCYLYLKGPD